MKIDKDMGKLSQEEYNKLIDISKDITNHLVKLCINDNALTLQTAEFAYCLGGLIFFKNIADAMKIEDHTIILESLQNGLEDIYNQIEARKNKEESKAN